MSVGMNILFSQAGKIAAMLQEEYEYRDSRAAPPV